jgi:hypothetical protein
MELGACLQCHVLGRLRQENHLSLGVGGQPEQHGKTHLKKKKKSGGLFIDITV